MAIKQFDTVVVAPVIESAVPLPLDPLVILYGFPEVLIPRNAEIRPDI